MTFKSLMKIRLIVTSRMLEIDGVIEALNKEVEGWKNEAGTCWIAEDPEYKEKYAYNRKRFHELTKEHGEMENILSEIENAELK